MTAERCKEIIAKMSDEELIDFATTASNEGIALRAEMILRSRYPSKVVMPRKDQRKKPNV